MFKVVIVGADTINEPVLDRRAAAIVAIETGDLGPVKKLKKPVENVSELIAAGLGAKAGSVKIIDMAVNPKSGRIYLSVNRGSQYAILTVNADGKIGNLDLSRARYVRVKLPGGQGSDVVNITDVKFGPDRVLAAGQSGKAFQSKIYSIPLPLTHGKSADIYSAETYHVAHGRWETRAPIQTFVPYVENGKAYVVGAFACTPIAKFPIGNLQSGAKVKGTSVVELGSGNRPLDMFTYTKKGTRWLVTHTDRFHWKRKGGFGPSRLWGVRINMKYLQAKNVNQKAARRNTRTKKGPEGIEIMNELFAARQVAKLDNDHMVVLREVEGGKLRLELVKLPD
ncbi:MAG: hypothetical protein IID45_06290 [Planctomycetes bacterium]|nr:hypothetical protein [Planctomycetota bacterium]